MSQSTHRKTLDKNARIARKIEKRTRHDAYAQAEKRDRRIERTQ